MADKANYDRIRASAITQRLPLTITIQGSQVQWLSHPPHTGEETGPDRPADDVRRDQERWGGDTFLCLRHLLRPLDAIGAGARRFGLGDFSQPIPVRRPTRPDELRQLAGTINTMGQDIREMLDAKRALLLAISHELRSPLTRARLNTELLPETPEVTPQRDALLRDLQEMAGLITDLLESERHGAGAAQAPELHLQPDSAGIRITVRDHGPGVPEAQLPHLAEPFFRLDSARSRTQGGVGLGLYLCKLVAQAHGGTFALRNAGPGLETTVRLGQPEPE